MKTKLTLILILIVSNIFWSYFYFTAETPSHNNKVQIYNLEGNGESWKIKNYKIIVTPDKILRGNAELIYMGSPENIKESNYFDITFYEENHLKEQVAVYSRTSNSTSGSISILDNLKDVGSITGPFSYDETLRTVDNYENSYVVINWNDNYRKSHTEKIDLNIIEEIVIKDDE